MRGLIVALSASIIAVVLMAWLLEKLGPDDDFLVDQPGKTALRRRIEENREQLRRDAERRPKSKRSEFDPPSFRALSDQEIREILEPHRSGGMSVTDGEP